MYRTFERLWLLGTAGKSARLKRQIALSNQIGLFGACATVPYQVFYFLYDIKLYLPIFLFNLLFIFAYLIVLWLSQRGLHNFARNLMLFTACTHITLVTYFISAGAGVHLFYFTIAGVLSLLFLRNRMVVWVALLGLVTVLFLVCQFAFSVGVTPVPSHYIDIMFAGSAMGAMAFSGVFSHLFRMEIDGAEDLLIASNHNLEKLSVTDQLTGVANRRSLDQFLNRIWEQMKRDQQPLSILMCDVDSFKAYNDHYGHQAGDACLQRIAVALKSAVRRPSDMLARYGGEEFVIILPQITGEAAMQIAEKIRRAVEQMALPHAYSEASDRVSISIGVSSVAAPKATENARALLAEADKALYAAKAQGRNCVVFNAAS